MNTAQDTWSFTEQKRWLSEWKIPPAGLFPAVSSVWWIPVQVGVLTFLWEASWSLQPTALQFFYPPEAFRALVLQLGWVWGWHVNPDLPRCEHAAPQALPVMDRTARKQCPPTIMDSVSGNHEPSQTFVPEVVTVMRKEINRGLFRLQHFIWFFLSIGDSITSLIHLEIISVLCMLYRKAQTLFSLGEEQYSITSSLPPFPWATVACLSDVCQPVWRLSSRPVKSFCFGS